MQSQFCTFLHVPVLCAQLKGFLQFTWHLSSMYLCKVTCLPKAVKVANLVLTISDSLQVKLKQDCNLNFPLKKQKKLQPQLPVTKNNNKNYNLNFQLKKNNYNLNFLFFFF